MNKVIGLAVGLSLFAVPFISFADSTVTASAGAGATVSPAGITVVPTGTTQVFSTGAVGGNYIIANVTVDGNSEGAVNSVSFTGINSDTTQHTIVVSARPTGGMTPWCSSAIAPGWHVDQAGGGCGSTETFVAYNHAMPDGTMCLFWGGCMISGKK